MSNVHNFRLSSSLGLVAGAILLSFSCLWPVSVAANPDYKPSAELLKEISDRAQQLQRAGGSSNEKPAAGSNTSTGSGAGGPASNTKPAATSDLPSCSFCTGQGTNVSAQLEGLKKALEEVQNRFGNPLPNQAPSGSNTKPAQNNPATSAVVSGAGGPTVSTQADLNAIRVLLEEILKRLSHLLPQ